VRAARLDIGDPIVVVDRNLEKPQKIAASNPSTSERRTTDSKRTSHDPNPPQDENCL
jgi:hypothetical protein